MIAMLDSDADEFEALLNDESVDVNADIGDGYGWTALHVAVYLNRMECLVPMLGCDRVNTLANYPPRLHTALHVSCSMGRVEITLLLATRMREQALKEQALKEETLTCNNQSILIITLIASILLYYCFVYFFDCSYFGFRL